MKFAATYFMTYHRVCKTNEDFINALRSARKIAANITRSMNHWPWHNYTQDEPDWEDPTADKRITHKVFPYRQEVFRFVLVPATIACFDSLGFLCCEKGSVF